MFSLNESESELIRCGRLIEAAKALRDRAGCTILEAKAVVKDAAAEVKDEQFGSRSDHRELKIEDLPKVFHDGISQYIWITPMQMLAQVRGWGWMQYHKNGAEFQDKVTEELVKRWNDHEQLRELLAECVEMLFLSEHSRFDVEPEKDSDYHASGVLYDALKILGREVPND